jgi:hypothetical protein
MHRSFLAKYSSNVNSQNGEDGILREMLRRLNITSGYVCEFGACDGMHLSNTFDLVQRGYKAVLIEADEVAFVGLNALSETYPKVTPICARVDHDVQSETSLDNLLATTDIPHDFDVLSIDIDSFDYQVWDSLKNYMPKIVVIEINSSIDFSVPDHIHKPDVFQGTGFLPMMNLAKQKGYEFVVHTGNMVFIRRDLYPILQLEEDPAPTPQPTKLTLRNGRFVYI